ncbi:hypothetical protein CBR_g515 [Chara braunii]|uniref:CCHC-type domain-containing protein n=1 Tax=Chara braunii TaxID=69332 RepID=A0A388KBE3_CHABU|nr:hypothetical protein CBR_g515 [Chara braunii]|eukprot:GBG67378.1 hypothetical protein CBR_g515 [Chara braunii]
MPVNQGQFGMSQQPLNVGGGGATQGTVTCYICGKTDHYSRNCWQTAGRSSPAVDPDTSEMKEFYRRAVQKEKEENERKIREEMDKRRMEELRRSESEKIREAEAREARLESTIVRLLSQHNRGQLALPSAPMKKKSPRSKARMLREIRSYLDESEDDSEEVNEEAGKLIDAIEKRKKAGKRKRVYLEEVQTSKKFAKAQQEKGGECEEEGMTTPRKNLATTCFSEGVVEYALEVHRRMSAKKVSELRKICGKEGIPCARKEEMICELVRCKTKLAYEGFFEKNPTPIGEK